MARATKEAKAQSHAKVLSVASRMIRERGIHGFGVAEVMSAAGLTHGGFYRHFKNKDELVETAVAQAANEFVKRFASEIDALGPAKGRQMFIDRYLSIEHVENPAEGCPIAAIAGQPLQSGSRITAILEKARSEIVDLLATGLGDAARSKADETFTLLVGAIVLARGATNPANTQTALSVTRTAIEASSGDN